MPVLWSCSLPSEVAGCASRACVPGHEVYASGCSRQPLGDARIVQAIGGAGLLWFWHIHRFADLPVQKFLSQKSEIPEICNGRSQWRGRCRYLQSHQHLQVHAGDCASASNPLLGFCFQLNSRQSWCMAHRPVRRICVIRTRKAVPFQRCDSSLMPSP